MYRFGCIRVGVGGSMGVGMDGYIGVNMFVDMGGCICVCV